MADPDGREREPAARSPGQPPDDAETEEPPRPVRILGRLGVWLALASLGLAVVGIVGLYFRVQPYANIATTVAIGGVTLAMFVGMVVGAYEGDYHLGRDT